MNSEVVFLRTTLLLLNLNTLMVLIFFQKGECTTPLSPLPAITQDWVVSA